METRKETANEILTKIATVDYSWIESFRQNQRNRYWTDYCCLIASKILQRLLDNKRNNLTPSDKYELAGMIDCTDERMKKILSGYENIDLKTIFDIEKALTIKLIEVIK